MSANLKCLSRDERNKLKESDYVKQSNYYIFDSNKIMNILYKNYKIRMNKLIFSD
jgi:hypothetical protein